MINNLKSLFSDIEGHWITHQTFYYLYDKTTKINKQNINIVQLNSSHNLKYGNNSNDYAYLYKYKRPYQAEVIYQYLSNNTDINISGILNKSFMNVNKKYNFTVSHDQYLKINYQKKEIKYSEYIYHINNNLKISITLIKQFNNYIAICFTSEIKIYQ